MPEGVPHTIWHEARLEWALTMARADDDTEDLFREDERCRSTIPPITVDFLVGSPFLSKEPSRDSKGERTLVHAWCENSPTLNHEYHRLLS